MNSIFILLALLQIKHWYIDFVDQTAEEVRCKGIYGHWTGIAHSFKHAVVTWVLVLLFAPVPLACALALLDLAIHYHTDWIKIRFGNRDITSPTFWNHLGLDQMIHQFTYIAIAFVIS
jgi:hypothetical protein